MIIISPLAMTQLNPLKNHGDSPLPAEQCETMADVRHGVDNLDQEIVALFARRFAYMRAAARIKTQRHAVRDEARKAEVIKNAQQAAINAAIPDALIADFWNDLVEASIAYEMEYWEEYHKDETL